MDYTFILFFPHSPHSLLSLLPPHSALSPVCSRVPKSRSPAQTSLLNIKLNNSWMFPRWFKQNTHKNYFTTGNSWDAQVLLTLSGSHSDSRSKCWWAKVPHGHFCSYQKVNRLFSHLVMSLVLITQNNEIWTRKVVDGNDSTKTILRSFNKEFDKVIHLKMLST